MKRVTDQYLRAEIEQILRGQCLDGTLGGDRKKGRRFNRAVRRAENAGPRACGRMAVANLKAVQVGNCWYVMVGQVFNLSYVFQPCITESVIDRAGTVIGFHPLDLALARLPEEPIHLHAVEHAPETSQSVAQELDSPNRRGANLDLGGAIL